MLPLTAQAIARSHLSGDSKPSVVERCGPATSTQGNNAILTPACRSCYCSQCECGDPSGEIRLGWSNKVEWIFLRFRPNSNPPLCWAIKQIHWEAIVQTSYCVHCTMLMVFRVSHCCGWRHSSGHSCLIQEIFPPELFLMDIVS